MKFFTVFTPTYNRAYILEALYRSLCEQTFTDFEWLIVDDGSVDDTQALIKRLQVEKKITIRYFYKENEGKHIAFNYGAQVADGEWFFNVDSDDVLPKDGLQIAYEQIKGIEDDDAFVGVAGMKGNTNGVAWTRWPNEKKDGTIAIPDQIDATEIEYRFRYKIKGDRAIIVKTLVLQRYPFPQFEGEKFLSEGYLCWNLAKDGWKLRWFNEVIYIAEYLEDGLSKNIVEIHKKSPKGVCCTTNLMLSLSGVPFRQRLTCVYNYYRRGFLTDVPLNRLVKQCNSKLLTPIGILLALLRK